MLAANTGTEQQLAVLNHHHCVGAIQALISRYMSSQLIMVLQAELTYKKREKQVAPSGWEAFNQKALYEAYEKRTSNIPYTQEVGPLSHAAGLFQASSFTSASGSSVVVPPSAAEVAIILVEPQLWLAAWPQILLASIPPAVICQLRACVQVLHCSVKVLFCLHSVHAEAGVSAGV